MQTNKLKTEIKHELINRILPFWNSLADHENGGFYGYVGHDLTVDKSAPKGSILHLRILWFYSECYKALKDTRCLELATHCYNYVIENFTDEYNSVNPIYSYTFFIYAVSNYYDASGDVKALEQAMTMFNKDIPDYDNVGALLHLIESHTELYRVSKNEEIKEKIIAWLDFLYNEIYDKDKKILPEIFGNKEFTVYGHEIEAAWLINRTLDILSYDNSDLQAMTKSLVDNIADIEQAPLPLPWWSAAESVVGFIDAGNVNKAEKVWEFIKANFIDTRSGGEWLNEIGLPTGEEKEIVGQWKCPYHNGRMCLEVILRDF
jgi:mannobiose 2-epimerase